jgi:hypothetical protein
MHIFMSVYWCIALLLSIYYVHDTVYMRDIHLLGSLVKFNHVF